MVNYLITATILLFVVASLLGGGSLLEGELDSLEVEEKLNNITWPDTVGQNINDSIGEPLQTFTNVVYKFADFVGYTGMEIVKQGAWFGYNNPQYDFPFYFQLIKWLLIVMIVSALAPLVLPLIALIAIAVMGLKRFIDWIINRRSQKKEVEE